jgi:transposase-like protein
MAFRYPTAFRESACKRMLASERADDLASERADDLANELEVSAATVYRWKKQSLIGAGRRPGLKSYEPDEMAVLDGGIKELEACRRVPMVSEQVAKAT